MKGEAMRFHGVHEVALLGSDGNIRLGYFNDRDLALRAIEQVPDYKAAWASLNPVRLPGGFPSPEVLQQRSSRASAGDVLFRVSLLVDFDPERPTDTNSTDAEKQAAREQAEQAREYLRGKGWPDPAFCDSGNGWHLRYGIELPNNSDSDRLVKCALAQLKNIFQMVDTTASDAARLCKLYGTWTRKGPNSEERPWRQSCVIEQGSDAVVTEQQLKALLPASPAPAKPDDAKLNRLLEFLERFQVEVRDTEQLANGWRVEIACPWAKEHTTADSQRGTVVTFIDGQGYGFKCLHGHCDKRHWQEFREKLDAGRTFSFGDAGPDVVFGGGLPLITHATLAEAFLRDNHDFYAVYDAPDRPIAQWIKTRWDISKNETIFWRAVADYLKGLYSKYPKPESGPDVRMRLFDTNFANGVVKNARAYLPAIKSDKFDSDPYLLGLPDCRVVELRTGAIRDMRKEDYLTKRIYVSPDPNCPTPRFDRFLTEITCGDGGLGKFLIRLGALCLTAEACQKLFFLWGRGRNGKGVFIRMLSGILGEGENGMAWSLRPDEITVKKFADSDMKRTFSGMAGKRLVTVNESIGENPNLAMLKLMSGGDTLSAARMRQDAVNFKPTHKLLLPTNDEPQLKADPAFKGRVRKIPFLADFTGREDRTLDATLKQELPGILYRLVTSCPDVIENGLREPASVMEATEQLFDELDVTKQFCDDCLLMEPGAEVAVADMTAAATQWLRGQATSGALVVSPGGYDAQAESVLHELRHYPGIEYARVRRGEKGNRGRVLMRVYVGVRLKE